MIFARPARRVLFLCTANVCRSPLAEALLRHQLRDRGLQRRVAVASAGTRVAQPGRRPDPRIVQLCTAAGVSLRGIRARPLSLGMLERSDVVLAMEPQHLEDMAKQDVPRQLIDRTRLLSRHLPASCAERSEDGIPDPYFADRDGFMVVYQLIDAAVQQLAAELADTLFD